MSAADKINGSMGYVVSFFGAALIAIVYWMFTISAVASEANKTASNADIKADVANNELAARTEAVDSIDATRVAVEGNAEDIDEIKTNVGKANDGIDELTRGFASYKLEQRDEYHAMDLKIERILRAVER